MISRQRALILTMIQDLTLAMIMMMVKVYSASSFCLLTLYSTESDDHLDLDRTGELSTQLVAEDAPEEQDITDAALHISELSKSLPPSVSFTIQRLASCIQRMYSSL
jgi:hypothetical protein